MKPQNPATMNLLSQQPAYHPHLSIKVIPNLANSSVIKPVAKEPKSAQLTIFYAGQVIVFDDFPADKAKEIMSYASKGISQSQNNSAYTFAQSFISFPPNVVRSSASFSSPFPFIVNNIPNTGNNSAQDHPHAPSRAVARDLPIARKASLIGSWRRERRELLPEHHIKQAIPWRPLISQLNPCHSSPWQLNHHRSESCLGFV